LFALIACSAEPATDPAAGQSPSTDAAMPDLARCDAGHEEAEGYAAGDEPIVVPAEFSPPLAASALEFAVLTRNGDTLCHSLAWVSQFESVEWLVGERLLGIEYTGYESFGYFLVDRAGAGSITEVGAKPMLSPNGRRLASLQLSEAAWGGLEGFTVWQLETDGHSELTRQQATAANGWTTPAPFDAPAHDWRMDGWQGNDCFAMSAIPVATEPPWEPLAERRDYFASEANAWRVEEGTCR
jgi:hypothetical protein